MQAENRKLEDWFNAIQTGSVALPRFQRFEAWSHQQVSALLDTVLCDLPAGAVLTLNVGDDAPFVSRAVKGAPALADKLSEYLLDGQQRITALWRSLHNDYSDRGFFIKVNADVTFEAVSTGRWDNKGRLFPLWADDPIKQWEKKYIPVYLLCPGSEGEKQAGDWVDEASANDISDWKKLTQLIAKLRATIANFNVPYLSLPRTTSKETALNVFIQMNTSSSPLTAYDIVVAQVEAGTGHSLHDLVDDLTTVVPEASRYLNPADWVLAVAALLQEKTPTKATYLDSNFSDGLTRDWEKIKQGIQRACQFLTEQKLFDNQRLATDVVLYPLAALWSAVPDYLDGAGRARTILSKYLWRAFFTERYERTSATRALVDFKELTQVLAGTFTDTPKVFDEYEFPLPTKEELIQAGWPKRRDRLPRAILALSLNGGAQDFADSSPVNESNIKQREYHHLYPDAFLQKQGFKDKAIYRALNCGLVTWKTNRNMAAKAPSVYMKERLGTGIDETVVKQRLVTHLINYDELIADHYDQFIEFRAELVLRKINLICA